MTAFPRFKMSSRLRTITITGLILIGSASFTQRADAVPRVDQEQPIINTSGTTQAIGGPAEQILVQTVTVGIAGMLTEVQFPVGCNRGSNLILEIQQVNPVTGAPTGVVLASETFTSTMVGAIGRPSSARLKTLLLSSPFPVAAGNVIALALRSPGICSMWPGPAGNSYAGGAGFFNARPEPLGIWSPTTASGYGDHAFRILVDAGRDPLKKAVVDQSQPNIDTSVGGLSVGGSSEQVLAQVITAGTAGDLVAVGFPVACDTGSTLIVEVQGVTLTGSGSEPNNVVMTSETISGSTLPTFFPAVPIIRPLVFSTPVSFSAGEQFAVVLRSPGQCGVFQGPAADPYTGGDGYFDARPNALGVWVEISLGTGRQDLPFNTWVD